MLWGHFCGLCKKIWHQLGDVVGPFLWFMREDLARIRWCCGAIFMVYSSPKDWWRIELGRKNARRFGTNLVMLWGPFVVYSNPKDCKQTKPFINILAWFKKILIYIFLFINELSLKLNFKIFLINELSSNQKKLLDLWIIWLYKIQVVLKLVYGLGRLI